MQTGRREFVDVSASRQDGGIGRETTAEQCRQQACGDERKEGITHRENLYRNAEIGYGNNKIICPHGDYLLEG
eukprot:scaffold1404_cov166-Amphora_coffeaeformis.AAC.10